MSRTDMWHLPGAALKGVIDLLLTSAASRAAVLVDFRRQRWESGELCCYFSVNEFTVLDRLINRPGGAVSSLPEHEPAFCAVSSEARSREGPTPIERWPMPMRAIRVLLVVWVAVGLAFPATAQLPRLAHRL